MQGDETRSKARWQFSLVPFRNKSEWSRDNRSNPNLTARYSKAGTASGESKSSFGSRKPLQGRQESDDDENLTNEVTIARTAKVAF